MGANFIWLSDLGFGRTKWYRFTWPPLPVHPASMSRHLTGCARGHSEHEVENGKVTDAEPALMQAVHSSETELRGHVWHSHTSVSHPHPPTETTRHLQNPAARSKYLPGSDTTRSDLLVLAPLLWLNIVRKTPGHNRHTNKTLPEPRGRGFQEPSWRKLQMSWALPDV